MNNERGAKGLQTTFTDVVVLLEKNLRYVEALGLDEVTLQAYRKVVSHLRARSPDEIERIIGGRTAPKKPSKVSDPELTVDQIAKLSSEQVDHYLAAGSVSRVFLERIATSRFGMTRGALSTLRSRDSLIEKLHTLLKHESTHEVISRAALGKQENDSIASED